MKKILITLLLIIVCFNTYADSIEHPFTCYPKKIQELFNKNGLKLDLDMNRTKESWGYLKNEGSRFYVLSYYSMEDEEFDTLTQIMAEYGTWLKLQ